MEIVLLLEYVCPEVAKLVHSVRYRLDSEVCRVNVAKLLPTHRCGNWGTWQRPKGIDRGHVLASSVLIVIKEDLAPTLAHSPLHSDIIGPMLHKKASYDFAGLTGNGVVVLAQHRHVYVEPRFA